MPGFSVSVTVYLLNLLLCSLGFFHQDCDEVKAFYPQCGTSQHEFGLSQTPIWILHQGEAVPPLYDLVVAQMLKAPAKWQLPNSLLCSQPRTIPFSGPTLC
ncbi:hypothetical protein H5410_008416 [Solanum commersonii]|uniref:Uncharacterized protein n=1 Tax=Solanum commersonii TaxID=4109 RepID=A0A9J6AEV3_SOLCO|nr:hypothetical protein H5410_008416 [Solanum commersonii]